MHSWHVVQEVFVKIKLYVFEMKFITINFNFICQLFRVQFNGLQMLRACLSPRLFLPVILLGSFHVFPKLILFIF